MPDEPSVKRTSVYFDAQNLFNGAKEAFSEFEGYATPTYDPVKLADAVCRIQSWSRVAIHFYTGIPEISDKRHGWWTKKLQVLGTRGVTTFTRQLRYRDQPVVLPHGAVGWARVGREKGIDVRLALDVVRHALDGVYDVALIFSQDQDLSEAVKDVKRIAEQQGRWIKLASAFPAGASRWGPDGKARNERGINGTKEIRIHKRLYDQCLDPTDYYAARRSN